MKLKFQIEKLREGHDARAGRIEVFAPEGYHFDSMEHSRICYSYQEARQISTEQIYLCTEDCVCKEEP